jgi:hypothetical protein
VTEETLSSCMKTSTFVFPSHYHEASKALASDLALLSSEKVDVPDIFH